MDAAREAIRCEPPSLYYDVLQPIASRVVVWETTYYHILAGPEGVLEWFRGNGPAAVPEALASDDERAHFEGMLLEKYSRRTRGGQVKGAVSVSQIVFCGVSVSASRATP